MSFSGYEQSNQDGRPVSLYEFRLGTGGDTLWFRYTSADHDISFGSGMDEITYTAIAINDGGASQGGGDTNSDSLVVGIQSDAAVAVLFDGPAPSEVVWLTKRRFHLDDPDVETTVTWVGKVQSCSWVDASKRNMNCITLLASMQSGGLRLCWERNCPHVLYGPGCKLSAEDFGFDWNIDGSNTNGVATTIRLPSTPPVAPLNGGFIKWTRPNGVVERRAITEMDGLFVGSSAVSCTILGGTEGLTNALAIRVYPGCDHTTGDQGCTAFDNIDNYGGFPFQPGKSPFDGDPVF